MLCLPLKYRINFKFFKNILNKMLLYMRGSNTTKLLQKRG